MTIQFVVNRLIQKFGMDIKIKKRVETVDSDGNVIFTFKDPVDARAWIIPAGTIREEWFIVGYNQPIDYLGIFKHNEDINIDDQVILDDDTVTEVREIFIRKMGTRIDFKDVVLVKI